MTDSPSADKEPTEAEESAVSGIESSSESGADEAETVIVTLQDAVDDADIERIASELEHSGLAVDQVLGFLGQIVGKAAPSKLQPLKDVKGVQDVELERKVQLPPPDSVVQ